MESGPNNLRPCFKTAKGMEFTGGYRGTYTAAQNGTLGRKGTKTKIWSRLKSSSGAGTDVSLIFISNLECVRKPSSVHEAPLWGRLGGLGSSQGRSCTHWRISLCHHLHWCPWHHSMQYFWGPLRKCSKGAKLLREIPQKGPLQFITTSAGYWQSKP